MGRGDNPFAMAPRSLVSDPSAFQAVSVRAEYCILASSTDPSKGSLEIADPELRFSWTRNQASVVRFDYDGFSQRWIPRPGGPPDRLGALSNDDRVVAPVPDQSVADAPFALYVGSPVRQVTFSVQLVGDESGFSPPSSVPAGTVQLSRTDGTLNFSSADVAQYGGQTVLCQRQSFFDRTKSSGSVGSLPLSDSVDYFLFLNPRPASGQFPLVRLGYGRHLAPIQVPGESSLGSPAPGTFTWALDTGRIRFASSDVAAAAGLPAYYDGVVHGTLQLARFPIGAPAAPYPVPAFTVPSFSGLSDSQRFVLFAEKSGQQRRYLKISLSDGLPLRSPKAGTAVVNVQSGAVYLSLSDILKLSSWSFSYVDSVVSVDSGTALQFYRSAVNGSGQSRAPDFRVLYEVENQAVARGLTGSPVIQLPTIPVVDQTLSYKVVRGSGSSGTFVGTLSDGTLASSTGLGYILDLDAKQLSFSARRDSSVVLAVATNSVKLEDGAISERGFVASKNGSPIVPGTDFDFDPGTGLVQFLDPVGESDPETVEGVSGQAVAPSTFVADSRPFQSADVGSWLLIQSGPGLGAYQISSISDQNPLVATLDGILPGSGAGTGSIRRAAEVVADRFWKPFRPPYKKFSLVRTPAGGTGASVPVDKFEVFVNQGQVNLSDPAILGDRYLTTYISLESPDGTTQIPTNRIEPALFKVRQEAAAYSPGSKTASVNPDGNTVNLARPMVVYVDGIILEPDAFAFEAPGTLRFPDPLSAQNVRVDYWIEEATGGNTSFDLLFQNVDLDFPKLTSGQPSAVFNGDQTQAMRPGSGVLVGTSQLLLVATSSYSPSSDSTSVTFTSAPTEDTDSTSEIFTSDPIVFLSETSQSAMVPNGSSSFRLTGDRSASYKSGTSVLLDSDPYVATGSRFDPLTNTTLVSLGSPARRNYAMPQVRRSRTPVLLPTASFQTSRVLNGASATTFVLMGPQNKILERDVDYTVADGGSITLTEPIGHGQSLVLFYVAKDLQPVGTQLSFSYSYAVAPSDSNGLAGQDLRSTYSLYSPDSFFYRVETFDSFLPEVSDEFQQDAQQGGVGGPNTADASSQSNKDFGVPGLYFEEQHQGNVDVVSARLLKFFNDLVNAYEDVLSGMDGRVVGGRSGRFRFDGSFDNPRRETYSAVTNDIDDEVKVYDGFHLTSFFTFTLGPVYALMADPSPLSRLFPTKLTKTVALNDRVSIVDFGQAMGSLDISNVKSVETMRSTRAREFFSAGPGQDVTVELNGDADLLVPPFASGQDFTAFADDGSPEVQGQVTGVSGSGPFTVSLSVPTGLRRGSLMRNVSDPANTLNHTYRPGNDLFVDPDTGQIINVTFDPGGQQAAIQGNELVDAPTSFGSSDTSPRRCPVFDGSELDDDGRVPQPRLRGGSETLALQDEQVALGLLGSAQVGPLNTISSATVPLQVGQSIIFLDGPNVGYQTSVSGSLGPGSYQVTPSLPSLDPTGSSFEVQSSAPSLDQILADEIGLLQDNVSVAPVPPALVGQVMSETSSMEFILRTASATAAAGTGTVTTTVLTDPSADFSAVPAGSLILSASGPNRGVYLVASATATTLTVDTTAPYGPFPSPGSAPYEVLIPESFLEADQFAVVAETYRAAVAFLVQTLAWQASPTDAGKVARIAQISARLAQLPVLADGLTGALEGLGLYDQRFLWVQQRTDRTDGSLVKKRRAASQRAKDLQAMRDAQLKLLVSKSL